MQILGGFFHKIYHEYGVDWRCWLREGMRGQKSRDARTEESRREDRRVEENRYNIILEVTVHIYR